MTFARDQVESAFRTYWQLGAVNEDWDVWCDTCFTEDVTYIEHILGDTQGRAAVREWIKPTMAGYGEMYFRHKRTRRNWGNGPELTRGACAYAESPGANKGA
jgi:hypothetical protein